MGKDDKRPCNTVAPWAPTRFLRLIDFFGLAEVGRALGIQEEPEVDDEDPKDVEDGSAGLRR